MAGQDQQAISMTISAAGTDGSLTVASVSGFFETQVGYITKVGSSGPKVKIIRIDGTNHKLYVQKQADYEGTENAGNGAMDNRLKPARYDYSDVSAFGDGSWAITCESQFIYATHLNQSF